MGRVKPKQDPMFSALREYARARNAEVRLSKKGPETKVFSSPRSLRADSTPGADGRYAIRDKKGEVHGHLGDVSVSALKELLRPEEHPCLRMLRERMEKRGCP